jgi:hypothetical protein
MFLKVFSLSELVSLTLAEILYLGFQQTRSSTDLKRAIDVYEQMSKDIQTFSRIRGALLSVSRSEPRSATILPKSGLGRQTSSYQ